MRVILPLSQCCCLRYCCYCCTPCYCCLLLLLFTLLLLLLLLLLLYTLLLLLLYTLLLLLLLLPLHTLLLMLMLPPQASFDTCGRLLSLWDERVGRQLVPEGQRGNLLRYYEDLPLFWDAWDVEVGTGARGRCGGGCMEPGAMAVYYYYD